MIRLYIQKELNMVSGKKLLTVDAQIAKGQFTALYGPSGAGKTTILRVLAGLLKPDEGHIEVDGEIWLDTAKKISLPPQQRGIGFVFQDHALFPNMTVRQNLLYALPAGAPKSQADELLELIGLTALGGQMPQTLSGGQKQRVALARALVRRPKLLLLDEPFSSLDDAMSETLRIELKKIHQRYGVTTLMVSHNMAEICQLAQQVISIDQGQVINTGTPAKVFGLQRAEGELMGQVIAVDAEKATVMIGNNVIDIPLPDRTIAVGDRVTLHTADLSFKKLL